MAQKLAMLGDSIIAQGLDPSANRTLNRWLSGAIASLLGPAFEEYYNEGVGGETIADCLLRIDDLTGSDADYVIVECGINDLSQGSTLQEMKDGYGNILRELKVAGKKVISLTVLDRLRDIYGGAVAKQQYDQRDDFNDWLRGLLAAEVIDGLADLDGAIGQDANGDDVYYFSRRNAGDLTHPDSDVCVALAKIVATEVRRVLEVNSVSDVAVGSNVLVTPAFMGNQGTSNNDTHITGNIATGWRFLDVQTGTEAIACETILDRPGGTQKLTFSGTPSGTGISDLIRDNQSTINIGIGETVRFGISMRTENLKGIVGIYPQLSLPLLAGTNYASAMYASPSDAAYTYRQMPPNMSETFWSLPYTAAEVLTDCEFRIGIAYLDNSPVSGSVYLYDPFVRITS